MKNEIENKLDNLCDKLNAFNDYFKDFNESYKIRTCN